MSSPVLHWVALGLVIARPISSAADTQRRSPGKSRRRNVVITADDREVSVFIPLQSVSFAEIEDFCRGMLSATGTLGHLRQRHSLVVHDRQANIKRIRAFIAAVDRPAVNIRIEVEFLNHGMQADGGLSVTFDGDRRGPKVVIADGKVVRPKSVTINAHAQRETNSGINRQQIMTLSGHPARLWVGRTIPDPSWLNVYKFLPVTTALAPDTTVQPVVFDEIVWRDVGSALYVLPTVHDSGVIDIDVFPAVTYVDGHGRRRAVRVRKVKTRIQAVDGRRVFIGGGDDATRRFTTSLFGPEVLGGHRGTASLGIYLTPHVVRPPRRPPAE